MNGRKPTVSEKEWLDAIVDLGCIVCWLDLDVYSPCEVHHTDGGSNHKMAIGLCFPHHRKGDNCPAYVSRHPFRKQFTKRYGTEEELLKKTQELVKVI